MGRHRERGEFREIAARDEHARMRGRQNDGTDRFVVRRFVEGVYQPSDEFTRERIAGGRPVDREYEERVIAGSFEHGLRRFLRGLRRAARPPDRSGRG